MKAEEAAVVLRELLDLAEQITDRGHRMLDEDNPSATAGLLWASRLIYARVTEIRSEAT